MSTHIICFRREIRKQFARYPLLSRPTVDTVLGKILLSKLFCLPSEKVSSLNRKNLVPRGADSFL